ncbi:F0F1 ATP synthase subunit epsilon [Desulfuromonas acetoxidans]|uniref:ATP synthase epsilon chain n=1 Tax=Desulfuromonas acetoxidans (strain DSM 684 / 11070) TaxID=281689 RepID=Q1JZG9_DESA6|nr:F0F1 ATP synthase subunit epsilon [Desulfuromonas acetoxidans]EAT15598.1 ATP synthase F1, epsilon subunit [Desulfuromonas acetoxidans DSM 684]MBF0645775.1 F0F1 ATP synthase subunit epsilon [Desulfuromonas acetoxidans]NVD25191.1 F0F1 ATP synthase subunit epsilon [Desulfuromonas acetoxidans]NVE17187.1 F0F1 ATP synthase subunit epsilon [Desulfuromonas acetoxidans]
MADILKLEMVTPYKRVLSEEVDEIIAPGALGELGILPGHTPLLTTLKVGELTYRKGGAAFHVAVNWGYVEVEEGKVTILAETAEPADEIDLARAKAALGRAEDALKKLDPEDKQFRIMEAALERAMIRIQVAARKAR